jgi:putative tricarboxylic transport membrane protein
VPNWKELGIDVEYATAQGFAAPKGAPAGAVAFWEGVLAKLAKDPEWQQMLERSLWPGAYMTAAEMQAYYASEFDRLSGVLTELDLVKQQ